MSTPDPYIVGFALASADPVGLLLAAEAGYHSGGYDGAFNAIATLCGYSLTMNLSYIVFFQQIIRSQLIQYRYLTNGPSLQYPNGHWYNFHF
jgi:hypothetical protein